MNLIRCLTSSCWMKLSPPDDAEGRCTFSLPGMAFARDDSGGEYHLSEDGSIGYYSSEGGAGRLAESMDDLFTDCELYLLATTAVTQKQYVDSKTLRSMGRDSATVTWKIWIWTAW